MSHMRHLNVAEETRGLLRVRRKLARTAHRSSLQAMGVATPLPRASIDPVDPRLRRLRQLAWLLDRSLGLGPRGRFGLDPLLGLIPGIGDWAGAALSLYIVYEATRLGLAWSVVGRMVGNIAIEALVGTVPIAGDAFDFVWQANMRNLQLVERHYRPDLRPRPLRDVGGFMIGLALALLALLVASLFAAAWVLRELWQFFVA